jgi:hypothetical protein
MSKLVKGSDAWKKAKEEARMMLDANLAAGTPHGTKVPIISAPGFNTAPKAPRKRASKTAK